MKLSEYDDEDIIKEVKHRGMTFKGFTTKELVRELRKREGVDAYDVSVDNDSRIILYGHGTEFVDTGTEKGAAIIMRITE